MRRGASPDQALIAHPAISWWLYGNRGTGQLLIISQVIPACSCLLRHPLVMFPQKPPQKKNGPVREPVMVKALHGRGDWMRLEHYL